MYRPRHAKKESLFSIIFTLFMTICILGIVIISFFGSWEKFVIEIIGVIPWGEFLFETIAQLLNVGLNFTNNVPNNIMGSIIEDCNKLLIASVLLPIARYFTGSDRPLGRHAAPLSLSNMIYFFIVDKFIVPVVVAIVSAWLVSYLSGLIWSLGDVWAWILSIAGTLSTIGVSVWVFYTLAAKTVWWGVLRMLAEVVPAAVSAMFSYAFLFLILILVSSPQYISVVGPLALIFLAIIVLLSIVSGKIDDLL